MTWAPWLRGETTAMWPVRSVSAAAAPTPPSAPSKPLPAAPKLVPDGARLFSGDFDPFGPPFLDIPTPVRRRR